LMSCAQSCFCVNDRSSWHAAILQGAQTAWNRLLTPLRSYSKSLFFPARPVWSARRPCFFDVLFTGFVHTNQNLVICIGSLIKRPRTSSIAQTKSAFAWGGMHQQSFSPGFKRGFFNVSLTVSSLIESTYYIQPVYRPITCNSPLGLSLWSIHASRCKQEKASADPSSFLARCRLAASGLTLIPNLLPQNVDEPVQRFDCWYSRLSAMAWSVLTGITPDSSHCKSIRDVFVSRQLFGLCWAILSISWRSTSGQFLLGISLPAYRNLSQLHQVVCRKLIYYINYAPNKFGYY